MAMIRTNYSKEEIDYLRFAWQVLTWREVIDEFYIRFKRELSYTQLNTLLKRNKIKRRRRRKLKAGYKNVSVMFTDEQLNYIALKYIDHQVSIVTSLFNEKYNTNFTKEQLKSAVTRHKIHSGRTGCFQKGNVPWSQGLKGTGLVKPNKGSFKPGQMPQTWVPIGTETVTKDGYLKRKVSDDRTLASRFNWKMVHIIVWERYRGPVPKGHIIQFKDGDKRNFKLSNLECIPRKYQVRLNKLSHSKIRPELQPAVRAIANIEMKRGERKRQLKKAA